MIQVSPGKLDVPFLRDLDSDDYLAIPRVFGLVPGERKNTPQKGPWTRTLIFGGEVFDLKFYKKMEVREVGAAKEKDGKPEKKEVPVWTIRLMGRYVHSIGDQRERRIALFKSTDLDNWITVYFQPLPLEGGAVQVPEWARPVPGRVVCAQLTYTEKRGDNKRAVALAPCLIGSSDGFDYDLFKPLYEGDVFKDRSCLATKMETPNSTITVGDRTYKVYRYLLVTQNRVFHIVVEGEVWGSLFPDERGFGKTPGKLADASSTDGYIWMPVVKFGDWKHSESGRISRGTQEEQAGEEDDIPDDLLPTGDGAAIPDVSLNPTEA